MHGPGNILVMSGPDWDWQPNEYHIFGSNETSDSSCLQLIAIRVSFNSIHNIIINEKNARKWRQCFTHFFARPFFSLTPDQQLSLRWQMTHGLVPAYIERIWEVKGRMYVRIAYRAQFSSCWFPKSSGPWGSSVEAASSAENTDASGQLKSTVLNAFHLLLRFPIFPHIKWLILAPTVSIIWTRMNRGNAWSGLNSNQSWNHPD